MKESSEKDNNDNSLICSICHQKKLNIKKKYSKIQKVFNDNLKDIDLSELVKKCNCNNKNEIKINQNNEIYVHKYCILLKIIFNFDIKCEKCNTIYNIEIDKKKDKIKKICLYAIFLIIYIIHFFIYLFCMFLLFINIILKEYTDKEYKHLSIFFGIIILIINTIFLYFTIITNIQKNKNIYKYSINIFDINDNYNFTGKNRENEFYELLMEFYQWFYNSQIKNLLTIINKKLFNNKSNGTNKNSIEKYIKDNNNRISIINKKNEKKINETKIKEQTNIQNNYYIYNNNSKEIILKDNKIDILTKKNNQNPKNIQKGNENYLKKESQEDLIINRAESNNSNNNINSRATNNIDSINNINHNDYINININPRTSKNININIHFSSDKNSIIDYSSSKENILFSSKRVNKYGKTALIPKKLTMTNIISEANSFKRKRRLIKSIKIKEYNLHLKGTGLPANIVEDEEVDFSEFDKIDSKISNIKDKKTIVSKNNIDLKYNNFRSKKSYKDIDLNISNSDPAINEDILINSNIRNTLKHHLTDKHVHFATPGNN